MKTRTVSLRFQKRKWLCISALKAEFRRHFRERPLSHFLKEKWQLGQLQEQRKRGHSKKEQSWQRQQCERPWLVWIHRTLIAKEQQIMKGLEYHLKKAGFRFSNTFTTSKVSKYRNLHLLYQNNYSVTISSEYPCLRWTQISCW